MGMDPLANKDELCHNNLNQVCVRSLGGFLPFLPGNWVVPCSSLANLSGPRKEESNQSIRPKGDRPTE